MNKYRIYISLIILLIACENVNFNIKDNPTINPSKKELLTNGKDVLTLKIDLQDEPHKDQKVFVSTSMGKLFTTPIVNMETEGVDSITLAPNSQEFSVKLRSELEFSYDSAIVTVLVNGYLKDEKGIMFKPSCPEELIASLDKDSIALNVNQEKLMAEIVTFCAIGSVSDNIRINYTLSDPSVAEVVPKILKTSNGMVSCEIIPKKIGTTDIVFETKQSGCDIAQSNVLQFKVYQQNN